jgi:hypothetical protein
MNVKDVYKLQVGMWFKTNTGLISRIKSINYSNPSYSQIKFPIIYSDDNKTCWDMESIVEYGWNVSIS